MFRGLARKCQPFVSIDAIIGLKKRKRVGKIRRIIYIFADQTEINYET